MAIFRILKCTMVSLFLLTVANQASAQSRECLWYDSTIWPICSVDVGAWGWESNASCVSESICPNVRYSHSVKPEPAGCYWYDSTFWRLCEFDNGGWGWENSQSCVSLSVCPDLGYDSYPACEFTSSDPDGDGWGWESGDFCEVGSGIPSPPSSPPDIENCDAKDLTRASGLNGVEFSGLAHDLSRDAFWSHPDSGSGGEIYKFSLNQSGSHCSLRQTQRINLSIAHRDWEDMTTADCRSFSAGQCLYIGEIGGNVGGAQPSVIEVNPVNFATASYYFSYSDGASDAEALMAYDERFYIIKKNGQQVLYRETGSQFLPTCRFDEVSGGYVTGGDLMERDGQVSLVTSMQQNFSGTWYYGIYRYDWSSESSFKRCDAPSKTTLASGIRAQLEAVTFVKNNDNVVGITEKGETIIR